MLQASDYKSNDQVSPFFKHMVVLKCENTGILELANVFAQ